MQTVINGRFEFHGVDCAVEIGSYRFSGRTALKVVAAQSKRNLFRGLLEGTIIAIATINVPFPLSANEVIIFDEPPNTGILDALVNANIVAKTGRKITTQHGLHEIVSINCN